MSNESSLSSREHALLSSLEACRSALVRYGEHADGCQAFRCSRCGFEEDWCDCDEGPFDWKPKPCDCGLAAALTLADHTLSAGQRDEQEPLRDHPRDADSGQQTTAFRNEAVRPASRATLPRYRMIGRYGGAYECQLADTGEWCRWSDVESFIALLRL